MKKTNVFFTAYKLIMLSCFFFFLFLLSTSVVSIFHSLILVNNELDLLNEDNLYLSLQSEDNPTLLPDTEDTIVNYKNLYNQLTINSNYDYYELYRQPLYITDFTGDSSLTEAQINNVSTIQSIQISKNVQDDFEIEPSSGTLLQIDDFIHEPNEIIPILIGANFKGTYEIEDIFSAEYLFFDYDFIVVGTLKSGSNIKIGSDYICLDNYIVMPSFDYVGTPSTKNEYVSTKIHYANKTSGWIHSTESNFENNYTHVLTLLKDSPLGNYSLSVNSIEKQLELYGLPLNRTFLVAVFFSLFFYFTSMIILKKSIMHIIRDKTNIKLLFHISLYYLFTILFSLIISTVLHNLFSITFQLHHFFSACIIHIISICFISFSTPQHHSIR